MAESQRTGRCAQIIPLPSAQARPVVQTRSGSGRYPRMVTQLWRVRAARRRAEYLEAEKATKIANLHNFLTQNQRLREMALNELRDVQLSDPLEVSHV